LQIGPGGAIDGIGGTFTSGIKMGRPESAPVMVWPVMFFKDSAGFADILSDATPPIARGTVQRQ
jgi:hypothetical protein